LPPQGMQIKAMTRRAGKRKGRRDVARKRCIQPCPHKSFGNKKRGLDPEPKMKNEKKPKKEMRPDA